MVACKQGALPWRLQGGAACISKCTVLAPPAPPLVRAPTRHTRDALAVLQVSLSLSQRPRTATSNMTKQEFLAAVSLCIIFWS